uniref:Uncharacterized protein n=1 Tax=Haemonchus contortus TaxID=6289 RepID=W6NGC6_HAECO
MGKSGCNLREQRTLQMSAVMPGRRRRRGEEDDRTLIDGTTKLICRQKSWSPSRLLSKKQSPILMCDPIGDQG